jgi:hypothetical protein
MRIEGPTRRMPVGGKIGPGASGVGRPAFTLDTGIEATPTHQAHAMTPTTGIEALLALQAVEDPLFAKRKAVRRGRSLIDLLEGLKADLLVGTVSADRLDRIVALVRQTREQLDPQLDALIEDIELRALVELAKLGRFPR